MSHPGSCECEVCSEPRIERIRASSLNTDGYYLHGLRKHWEAIAIGPNSMVDRCIVAKQSDVEAAAAQGAATTFDLLDAMGASAIPVSVERPHIGRIQGPLAVFTPWARSVRQGSPVTRGRFSTSGLETLGVGGEAQERFIEPTLDIMTYPRCPTWLPTMRAPYDFVTEFTNFGTTGESLVSIKLPAWGRQVWQFAFNFNLGTGTVAYGIEGITLTNWGTLGSRTAREIILATTTTSAAFSGSATYRFDGEFDIVDIDIEEADALDAGSRVTVWAKAWDR